MEKVSISRDKYETLLRKAELFEKYLESEEISKEELAEIKSALEGPFLSKEDFLKKHPELEG